MKKLLRIAPVFFILLPACNNEAESEKVEDSTIYFPTVTDTMKLSPPPTEELTVRGVGIINSGPDNVSFYLTSTGEAPFTEESLSPNEAHDYQIAGDQVFLLISTEGNVDKYPLNKNSRYHLIYDNTEQKWIVVSDR